MAEEALQFGAYSVIEHLATGGMAEVFVARKVGLQGFEKVVVLKRIRPELTHDVRTMGLFLDEARLVATLEHPNIAQVYEIEHVSDSYFIVMEYVQGGDLRQLIDAARARRRPISLDDAVYIISHVCAALHYAHEKRDRAGAPLDIIHRDISPSNVLVSHDGAIKVCDFGIAKVKNRTTETIEGVLKGKLSYMSPEQCKSEPLDRLSDVFAIGILLFELSTLSKLFTAKSEFELLRKIIEDPVPLPSKRVAGYPPELERIVMRALAKRPQDRYPTAQAMQADLEAFAREHRLAMSSINISKLMAGLIERSGSGPWRAAEFAEHEADTDVNTTEIVTGPPAPSRISRTEASGEFVVGERQSGLAAAGPVRRTSPGVVPYTPSPTPPGTAAPVAASAAPVAPAPVTPAPTTPAPRTPAPRAARVSEPPAPRPRPNPMWLVGALAAGGLAAGSMLVGPGTVDPSVLRARVDQLGATLDAVAMTRQNEVTRIAATPTLRAAITTDAATLHDLAANEHAIAASPGEVLEIFQLRDATMASLLRLPADARPLPVPEPALADKPSPQRLTSDGKVLRLTTSAPILGQGGGGAVVVVEPVDLALAVKGFASSTVEARLTGVVPELPLTPVAATGGGAVLQLPVPSRLTNPPITVVATIAAPTTPSWLAVARIALAALAAVMLAIYFARLARGRTPRTSNA